MRGISALVFGALLTASVALGDVREHLVVVHVGDGSIVLLDPASGADVARIRVGIGPREVSVTADGKMAAVANYGQGQGSSLSVVDLVRGRLARTIALRHVVRTPGEPDRAVTYHRPHGLRFLRDQRHLVVSCEAEGALLLVDAIAGKVVAAIETEQEQSSLVVLDHGGRKAFVANRESGSVSVVDLNRRRVVKIIETGGGAEGMALHPSRDELWVANSLNDSISIIDTVALEEIKEFASGAGPSRLAFTPDGDYALCINAESGTVSVFSTKTRRVKKEIRLDPKKSKGSKRSGSSSGPSGIVMRPSGASAYVSCSRLGSVAEIDTKRWKVIRYLEVDREPDGLAWSVYEDDITSAK